MKYFSISELTKSDTAQRLGINNAPGPAEQSALRSLVDKALDPLREAWGKPITVNSGFRCEALNKAVGGAADSQHRKGEAADIEAHTRSREDNRRIFELVLKLGLPFDQLINEFDYDWVHISVGPRNRRQVLAATKVGGRTVYSPVKV